MLSNEVDGYQVYQPLEFSNLSKRSKRLNSAGMLNTVSDEGAVAGNRNQAAAQVQDDMEDGEEEEYDEEGVDGDEEDEGMPD